MASVKPCFNIAAIFWRGILLASLILATISAAAAFGDNDPAKLVDQGNASFQKGDYLNAASSYRRAIAAGAENGHVYFNLGNAYYRLENYGKAIASYRLALWELPGDADIRASLELARKQQKDKILDVDNLYSTVAKKILLLRPALPPYQMQRIFLILYGLGWLSFLCYYFFRNNSARSLGYTALILSLVWGVFTFGVRPGRDGSLKFAFPDASSQIPAVVVAPEVKLYSGDAENYQVVFVLHDGAEVLTGEQRKEWTEVLLPDGRRGWTKNENLNFV